MFIGTDPTDPSSRFVLSSRSAGGQVTIQFPFAIGPDYRLEYSDNLATWLDVATFTLDEIAGTITFTPAQTRRYYRLVAE